MKKVINGKLYNTETAEKLGDYWNGLGSSNFNNCSEILFKTKKGNYFLHGKGGAATKYAECSGKYASEGVDIIEYTRRDAMEWLSEHDFPNIVEEEFPDLIEEA